MKHVITYAFSVLLVASCTGSGTETDNPATPLTRFDSSACKNKELDPGQQALVLESDADGLTCVEWTRGEAGALTLALHNFAEPCGDTYLGRASVAGDGALELSVYKDICAVAKCGTCVFDFEFELQNIDAAAPLRLRIGSSACESQPATYEDELELPIDREDTGIVCRQLDHGALSWYARGRDSCGQANMPCGPCDEAGATSCAEGLACTALADGDSRCLVSCAASDDCPAGLTSCEAGVCQASKTW
jgi:hypothetical protein